ncbi:hypothetical protein ASG47_16075 [Devosia sp. Leaf420]|nr:hypothetical protein ASG47_16075 [Devosia sp. Leaf420]
MHPLESAHDKAPASLWLPDGWTDLGAAFASKGFSRVKQMPLRGAIFSDRHRTPIDRSSKGVQHPNARLETIHRDWPSRYCRLQTVLAGLEGQDKRKKMAGDKRDKCGSGDPQRAFG